MSQNQTLYIPGDEFITAYGPKIKISITFPPSEDRTKQSFKTECDINHILAKFQRTGVLDFAQKNEARYADITGLDYQNSMNMIAHAKTMFGNLPSSVRTQFDNNPAAFFDFVQNPANREQCEQMGLMKAAATPADDLSTPPTGTPPVRAANEAVDRPEDGPGESERRHRSKKQTNSPT